jgi:hypothetical protein
VRWSASTLRSIICRYAGSHPDSGGIAIETLSARELVPGSGLASLRYGESTPQQDDMTALSWLWPRKENDSCRTRLFSSSVA